MKLIAEIEYSIISSKIHPTHIKMSTLTHFMLWQERNNAAISISPKPPTEVLGVPIIIDAETERFALSTDNPELVAGRTLEQWWEHSKKDNCFDSMVPSDLRAILNKVKL